MPKTAAECSSGQRGRCSQGRQERATAKYVISYRAPDGYVPGREDDMAAWGAWFTSIGEDLVDFGALFATRSRSVIAGLSSACAATR